MSALTDLCAVSIRYAAKYGLEAILQGRSAEVTENGSRALVSGGVSLIEALYSNGSFRLISSRKSAFENPADLLLVCTLSTGSMCLPKQGGSASLIAYLRTTSFASRLCSGARGNVYAGPPNRPNIDPTESRKMYKGVRQLT